MQTITVTNYKGGSGKTTSTAFLAHAFRELGRSVLLVDADPQLSLLKWSARADWDIPTMALAERNLHRQLPGIAGTRYDVILIDTPPLKEQAGIVQSALRAADTVLVPMAPSRLEIDEIPYVMNAVEEIGVARDIELVVNVLLNRTKHNAGSTKMYRETLTDLGCRVQVPTIAHRDAIAQAGGFPISGDLFGYFSAAEELERLHQ